MERQMLLGSWSVWSGPSVRPTQQVQVLSVSSEYKPDQVSAVAETDEV